MRRKANNPQSTQQIGQLGELLVQFKLLRFGIESARMTTDSGVDLVAYGPNGKAKTIQIKANLKPRPGGGNGRPALSWWVPDDCRAELFAFVNVESQAVWLMRRSQFNRLAQQHSSGRRQLYMFVESDRGPSRGKIRAEVELYDRFLIERVARKLFL